MELCTVPLTPPRAGRCGDRHGTERNTVLNLAHATSFGEFFEEIRSGYSNVLITPGYREPHGLRILKNFEAMAGDIDNHAHTSHSPKCSDSASPIR